MKTEISVDLKTNCPDKILNALRKRGFDIYKLTPADSLYRSPDKSNDAYYHCRYNGRKEVDVVIGEILNGAPVIRVHTHTVYNIKDNA